MIGIAVSTFGLIMFYNYKEKIIINICIMWLYCYYIIIMLVLLFCFSVVVIIAFTLQPLWPESSKYGMWYVSVLFMVLLAVLLLVYVGQ